MDDKASPVPVRIGSCTFDPARGELLGAHGQPVHLRPQALHVLEVLLAHAGIVVRRDDLIAAVWPGVVVTDDSLVQCIGDIRRALGADHALLHTLPRRGYRLDVTPASAAVVPSGRARRWRAWAAGALLVSMGAIGWLIGAGTYPFAGPVHGSGPVALAVRMRYDAPRAAQKEPDATFAAGMAEQLVSDLTRNTEFSLVSAPTADADAAPADLARRLAARYVVDGWVQVRPTGLQLITRLVDASNGTVLWTERSESALEGQRADREALLRRIARSAHVSMRLADGAVVVPVPARSIETHQLVMRALARVHRFDRDEYRIAHEELAQALEREPGFALAWAVRGYLDAVHASAHLGGELSQTRRAELVAQCEHAISLDPRPALAHQAHALALVVAGRPAEALRAAESALQRAALDPRSEWVLANALVADGRMATAMQAMARAQSRYPVTPAEFDFVRAKVLWGNDRFDEAIEAASRCLEKAPQFVACRAIRALVSDGMGRLEAAREDLKKYRVAVPGAPVTFGPGSYGVPKLQNDWLADIRHEIGLP